MCIAGVCAAGSELSLSFLRKPVQQPIRTTMATTTPIMIPTTAPELKGCESLVSNSLVIVAAEDSTDRDVAATRAPRSLPAPLVIAWLEVAATVLVCSVVIAWAVGVVGMSMCPSLNCLRVCIASRPEAAEL